MKSERPLLIIQARLTSKRFKNKILTKLTCGLSILEYLLMRLEVQSLPVTKVVAIPDTQENDALEEFLQKAKIPYFRGSEDDVLSRYYHCAKSFNANTVLRINSDCPLIDPTNIKEIIKCFKTKNIDYMSTILDKSFPLGEHIEIFNFKALKLAYKNAVTIEEREHVTPYLYNKMKNKCLSFSGNFEHFKLMNVRLCIDYQEDLELINHIINHFHPRVDFKTAEIIDFLSNNPQLKDINSSFMKPLKINL